MSEEKGRNGQASSEKSAPVRNARRFRVVKVAFVVLICCGVGLFAGDWQMNQSYLTAWLAEQAAAAGVELELTTGNATTWTNTFDIAALVRNTATDSDDNDDKTDESEKEKDKEKDDATSDQDTKDADNKENDDNDNDGKDGNKDKNDDNDRDNNGNEERKGENNVENSTAEEENDRKDDEQNEKADDKKGADDEADNDKDKDDEQKEDDNKADDDKKDDNDEKEENTEKDKKEEDDGEDADDDKNDNDDGTDDSNDKGEKKEEKKKITDEDEKKNKRDTSNMSETAQRVQQAIDDLRSEFHERYGPDSQEILRRGIYLLQDAHENLGCYNHTARRILQRRAQTESNNNKDKLLPFVLGVSGYSISVSRGNFFSQSYSFLAADVLREVFELLGLDLQVRNHGIGGIPSFPYGWCLTQFLGQELDVLMWDYRLNEVGAQHDATLEAYVRNVLTAFAPAPPLFVLVDWTPREVSKLDVLQYYLSHGVLPDAVGIAFDETALDVKKPSEETYAYLADKLQNDPESLPAGFQNWTDWGSPKGTPGQAVWHMRFKQHEMAAWFLVMYFTNVLEIVVTLMDTDDWMQGMSDNDNNGDDKTVALPAPKTDHYMKDVGTNVRSMTYGVPQEKEEGTWTIPPLECFTSFEPLVSGRLDQLVVSGLVTGTPEGEDFDPTPNRPSELYEGNWVVDLSSSERNAKQKTKALDLGYIDAKVALSGVSTSGPLRLWIPVSVPGNPKQPTLVRDVLETLVVCEVNEAQGRNGNPCKMTRDVSYSVSNLNVSEVFQVESVAHYPYQGPICVSLEIPLEAELQQRPTDGNFTDLWQTTVDVGEQQLQKDEEREWGVELELYVSRTDLDLSVRPCTVSQIVTQTKVDQEKK